MLQYFTLDRTSTMSALWFPAVPAASRCSIAATPSSSSLCRRSSPRMRQQQVRGNRPWRSSVHWPGLWTSLHRVYRMAQRRTAAERMRRRSRKLSRCERVLQERHGATPPSCTGQLGFGLWEGLFVVHARPGFADVEQTALDLHLFLRVLHPALHRQRHGRLAVPATLRDASAPCPTL